MIYNSLREPAHRTACTTASHPDHHNPGHDSVLLRGTCGNYGRPRSRRGGRDTYVHSLAYAHIESFPDAGPEHPYTQSDSHPHRNPNPDRYFNHHANAFCPSLVDALDNPYTVANIYSCSSDINIYTYSHADRYTCSSHTYFYGYSNSSIIRE